MNPMTKFMAILGAFGSSGSLFGEGDGRAHYPYSLSRDRKLKSREKSRSRTKKGPGRCHNQGLPALERSFKRKMGSKF